jgi:hypothetical protein
MTNFSAVIASVPDRENVVFKIWLESYQVAEISLEPGRSLEIEIFPPPEGKSWNFDLADFTRAIDEAKANLGK